MSIQRARRVLLAQLTTNAANEKDDADHAANADRVADQRRRTANDTTAKAATVASRNGTLAALAGTATAVMGLAASFGMPGVVKPLGPLAEGLAAFLPTNGAEARAADTEAKVASRRAAAANASRNAAANATDETLERLYELQSNANRA